MAFLLIEGSSAEAMAAAGDAASPTRGDATSPVPLRHLGIVALSTKSAFVEDGLVWSNLKPWGWVAIVVSRAQCLAGLLILSRRFAGQWLGGIFALVMNFLSVGAYPLRSLVALAANALVLWAVTAHGDEFD